MITPILRCSAGIDVHKATVVCTVIKEVEGGKLKKTIREYSTFRKDLRIFASWLKTEGVELAVMESTGIYWKAVFEALEDASVTAYVVNARHVKNVPGRKTDVGDSEWLAELCRCGLLRASFVPPRDFRELRMLTRYRRKLSGQLAGEKNRLHKVLDSSGIRLGCVVSNIDGVSAHNMIDALIESKKTPYAIAEMALGQLRGKKKELRLSLDGQLSDRHRFLLIRIRNHIQWLAESIQEIDDQVVAAMEPYQEEWRLMQTIPGIDKIGAAMLLAEIGVDMSRFGKKERLSSWAGMCPGNNESAGKKKSGRCRPGNKYVRSLLCEISNSARKTRSQFQGVYQGLVIRRGHKKTIIALGHRILKVIFVVLSRKEPYRDPVVDYEALVVHRNAPRWIKVLKKYGYIASFKAA
jgi:transposase